MTEWLGNDDGSLAVLDLDLAELPDRVTVDSRHSGAFVVLRYRGRAVGTLIRPVSRGELLTADLRQDLLRVPGHALGDALLDEWLERDRASAGSAALRSVSVAICTHERPDDLELSLASVSALSPAAHEILVVDSGPRTERTRVAVERFGHVRYLSEERPGLDRARNRALREATGEIVAFTDDDAVVDPAWLGAFQRPFADPLVLITTGLTLPSELDTQAQRQHERFSTFARGFQPRVFEATRNSPGAAGHPGAGVNMAVRKTATDRVGAFDEALDAGTPTRSGGDYEYFSRVLGAGYRIAYEPRALSFHRHRRTQAELRRAFFGYGVGAMAALTRSFWYQGEWSTWHHAGAWIAKHQIPDLFRAWSGRRDCPPSRLTLAQLAGCAWGPAAYALARWRS